MIITNINTKPYGLEPGVNLRILREDLFPLYGGGNKARKLNKLLQEIKLNANNAVVTTGSVFSNHCRATALMCSNNALALTLVIHGSKQEYEKSSYHSGIINATGHRVVFCKPEMISDTMDYEMNKYITEGKSPYYLNGGGHNKKGVEAYIELTEDLAGYFKKTKWKPDYLFLPSGTGSTQAGIVIGSILNKTNWNTIGISIARSKERGINSILEVFKWFNIDQELHGHKVIVDDSFLAGGYGKYTKSIQDLSLNFLRTDSLFLDPVYSAKAMWGTIQYIRSNRITGNVLFINTGGFYNYFNSALL